MKGQKSMKWRLVKQGSVETRSYGPARYARRRALTDTPARIETRNYLRTRLAERSTRKHDVIDIIEREVLSFLGLSSTRARNSDIDRACRILNVPVDLPPGTPFRNRAGRLLRLGLALKQTGNWTACEYGKLDRKIAHADKAIGIEMRRQRRRWPLPWTKG